MAKRDCPHIVKGCSPQWLRSSDHLRPHWHPQHRLAAICLVGLATIVAAVLANVVVYYLGRVTVGYDPQFTILADVGTTIFFTVIPAIVAVLLYGLLLRFARRPARTFAIIAAVVYVVTTIPDFTYIPSAPGANARPNGNPGPDAHRRRRRDRRTADAVRAASALSHAYLRFATRVKTQRYYNDGAWHSGHTPSRARKAFCSISGTRPIRIRPMYNPTTRLLTILELLQAHQQLSGAALAARLEIDRRTVRRYITMLQDLGLPIAATTGRYGGYRLRPGYKLPPLIFSEDEAVALMLGLLTARRLGLASAAPAIEGALAKVARVLPGAVRARVGAIQETVTLDLAAAVRPADSPLIATLSTAAQQGQQVRLHYRSRDQQETERLFDSYAVVYHAGLVVYGRLLPSPHRNTHFPPRPHPPR